MTEETDGLDESSPYIYIGRRACPRENGERLSYGFIFIIEGVCNTPLLFLNKLETCNPKAIN
jgi:hypothetical protein